MSLNIPNIKNPPGIRAKKIALCKLCRKVFEKKKPWQQFHSSKCRAAYHNAVRAFKMNLEE